MIGRLRLAAGAVVLVFCAQYLVLEAVTASAWRTPPYSYSRNYISDLGVTACLPHGVCSPWGLVMNVGFVVSGAVAVLAATLLAPLVRQARWRRLLLGLAIAHGAGSALVGLVQSAPGSPAGTPRLHLVGAYSAILGGNLALVVAGIGLRQRWIAPWFRWFSVAIGAVGIGNGLLLVLTTGWPTGLLERGAVDTITVWEVGTGVLLGLALLRGRVPAS